MAAYFEFGINFQSEQEAWEFADYFRSVTGRTPYMVYGNSVEIHICGTGDAYMMWEEIRRRGGEITKNYMEDDDAD